MPMVVMNEGVNESSLNRSKQHDLPTPESPMRSNFIYNEEYVSAVQEQVGGRAFHAMQRRTTAGLLQEKRRIPGNHSFLIQPWL